MHLLQNTHNNLLYIHSKKIWLYLGTFSWACSHPQAWTSSWYCQWRRTEEGQGETRHSSLLLVASSSRSEHPPLWWPFSPFQCPRILQSHYTENIKLNIPILEWFLRNVNCKKSKKKKKVILIIDIGIIFRRSFLRDNPLLWFLCLMLLCRFPLENMDLHPLGDFLAFKFPTSLRGIFFLQTNNG